MIDRWLIAHRPQQPHARAFLLWAATSGLAPANVAIATASRRGDRDIMSDADRIVTALKLETDDSLPPADRVAGPSPASARIARSPRPHSSTG